MTKEEEKQLLIDLAVIGCEKVNPDNPLRVAVSVSSLVDVLIAAEKYLAEYDKIMRSPASLKRGADIATIQNEFEMYVTIARLKLGGNK
uniref:Uncharacterized protein n=1 Tax=viral metagenome TaxID=1070528 RepID=A0A6H1ZWI5_9ZZZZ